MLVAPSPDKYREIDIFFLRPSRIPDIHDHPVGTDLMIEVVNPGAENRGRDYVEKRRDYARVVLPNIGSTIRTNVKLPC